MKVTTLRLPQEMYSSLEDEAEEYEMSVSEYVRAILRDRENTQPNTIPNTPTPDHQPPGNDGLAEAVDALTDRLEELEQREAKIDRTNMAGPAGATPAPNGDRSSGRDPKGRSVEDTPPAPATGDNSDDPALDDLLAGWRPGRSREDRDRRRKGGRAALEWLRAQKHPVGKADAIAELYPDHALDGQQEDTFWRKIARPALQLAVDADVATYSHGRHEYEWGGSDGDDTDSGGVYDPTSEF